MLFAVISLIKMKNKIKIFNLLVLVVLMICLIKTGEFSYTTQAINPADYNKSAGDNLSRDDWNRLDEDFIMREGDAMGGSLNLGSRRITSASTNTASDDDLANVDYVNSLLVSSQGGYIYTSWGVSSCGSSDTLLYSGFGFNATYNFLSGGSNNLCIQLPFNATTSFPYSMNSNARTDGIFPLMTSDIAQLPPEMSTMYRNYVECAVCFRSNSSCIELLGGFNCSMSGFTHKAYDGYVLGGEIPGSHYHSQERICVNRNMHVNTNAAPYGAVAYGSRIRDNFGQTSYGINRFIPCAICCN